MKSVPKKNNGMPWPAVVVFVIIAVLTIQGYFFFFRKTQPPVAPVKPVPTKVVKPKKPEVVVGRIAVVLDDWGYNRSHCKYLAGFQAPVAAAIMPNLPYSQDVVQCARAAHQEAMLHLPIEPKVLRETYPRGYMLTTEMSQHEVKKLLVKILDGMPGIVGVNNHEGSKGTESSALMATIMAELKRRGLFFVDSVTSMKSICPDVAAKVGISFSKRDVFLDNRNERVFIERQFALAAKIAKEKGYVLAIGHDRALTLQILGEQIHKLKAQGYEFLTIKDFIKAQGR